MTNSSPYDNFSDQCLKCGYMSFGGCTHPSDEVNLQDKGIENCKFYYNQIKEADND